MIFAGILRLAGTGGRLEGHAGQDRVWSVWMDVWVLAVVLRLLARCVSILGVFGSLQERGPVDEDCAQEARIPAPDDAGEVPDK